MAFPPHGAQVIIECSEGNGSGACEMSVYLYFYHSLLNCKFVYLRRLLTGVSGTAGPHEPVSLPAPLSTVASSLAARLMLIRKTANRGGGPFLERPCSPFCVLWCYPHASRRVAAPLAC